MKKIIYLLVLGAIFFSLKEVKAIELPKDYEVNGIKYTISGMHINVYNEDGFFTNTVYKSIPIPNDKININPTATTIKVPENTTPASGVKINYSLTDTTIEQLVKEEIPTVEDGTNYFVIVVLDYKITEIPNDYKYVHYVNFLDATAAIIKAFNGEEVELNTKIELNKDTYQFVDAAVYGSENGNLFYEEDSINDTNLNEIAVQDYVVLSNSEKLEFSDSTLINPTSGYRFFIHDIDDIEKTLESASKESNTQKWTDTITSSSSEENKVVKEEKVKVPNTGLNSIYGIVGLLILTITISSFILFTIKRKIEV